MVSRWYRWIALWAAAASTVAGAQPAPTAPGPAGAAWRFQHLTIDDGLSQNVADALLQDRQGFIWIGTKDGLNRFDGVEFVVYRHDPFDVGTLSEDHVTALTEDHDGTLWIGTDGGGLNRFDRVTGRAVRYRHSPTEAIDAIAVAPDGAVWVATWGDGVHRLDGADRDRPDAPFTVYPTAPGPASIIGDVISDPEGTVWAATDDGIWRLPVGAAAFVRHSDGDSGGLLVTRGGVLWSVATDPPSPYLSAQRLTAGRSSSAAWVLRNLPVTVTPRVRSVAEGPDGALWIAPGLAHVDPATRDVTVVPYADDEPFGLRSGTISLLWDRGGVLWAGTNGYGIDRFDARGTRFERIDQPDLAPVPGFSVRTIHEARGGDLWISAGTVLYRKKADGSWEVFKDRGPRLGVSQVYGIAEDRKGRMWVAMAQGLVRYDPATGTQRPFPREDLAGWPGGGLDAVPLGLVADRRGTLWGLTARYLVRIDDPETGRATAFRYADTYGSRVEDTFPPLVEDGRGGFWIGTGLGLVRFDPETGASRRYTTDPDDPASLRNDRVLSILPDPRRPDDVLWVGTAGGGLNRLDVATGRFTHVTTPTLPNDVVYGVLPDAEGRLWLSTNRGLARYDPETGDVRAFDVNDGLQSNEFNAGASHRGRSGRLYFGGIHGVSAFDPMAVTDNPHRPPTVLTGLSLGGRPVAVGDSTGLLDRELWATDALHLGPRQNAFTFTFAALDYAASEKNRYAYRLDGFDPGWVEAGTRRTATYTNVPPGRYTFRVRGTNNDGVWGDETALTVVVAAPWWRTLWALAVWAALGVGAVLAVGWARRSRADLRQRLDRERLEAEQLRTLDQSRSRLFANVSHEFRTPLTLTIGPLDDIRDGLYGDVPAPLAEPLDLARRNAGRVLSLINQILEVARLEAGRVRLEARPVDLGALADRGAEAFRPLADRRGITFTVDPPPSHVVVYGDPEHLGTILSNLLSNALKFTPQGGAVRVSVGREAEAGTACLAVRDSGPGIPPADLPNIFDRFHRIDPDGTRAVGTGIGLALAKELSELHGGSLSAESDEGFGSTFTLTLPLGHEHLPVDAVHRDAPPVGWLGGDDTPAADALEAPPALSGDGQSAPLPLVPLAPPAADDRTTVLVVEDHPDLRAHVRRHLEPAYRVVEAADGEAGLRAARALLPDLVLSDVMMPGLDGLALCRALKAGPATDFIPVVLLTARAAPEDRVEGLAGEADDYLTKPFDPSELRARVANLIRGRRRLAERYRREGVALVLGDDAEVVPTLQPSAPDATPADVAFTDLVRAAIEASLDDETFGVEALAAAVGLSRSQLHRRLRETLDVTPSEALRTMRLERAAQLLAVRAGTVSEVAYAVGFKSVSHFSNAFAERFGHRPSEHMER